MFVSCKRIIELLEEFAPIALAESWDNGGLIVGNPNNEVKKILVALDAVEPVIDEAIALGADLIVTHHPIVFNPIKKITYDDPTGKKLIKLIKNDIGTYACHTHLDVAWGGTNDTLAKAAGLRDIRIMTLRADGNGINRLGELQYETTFQEFAMMLKSVLGLDTMRVIGDLTAKVKRVGLCTGSGFEFLKDAQKNQCQVFITSDIKYHESQEIIDSGVCVIDATHFASENLVIPIICDILKNKTKENGYDVEIIKSDYNGQTFTNI